MYSINVFHTDIEDSEMHASVAQRIEQEPSNLLVGGSIPSWGAVTKTAPHPSTGVRGGFLYTLELPQRCGARYFLVGFVSLHELRVRSMTFFSSAVTHSLYLAFTCTWRAT